MNLRASSSSPNASHTVVVAKEGVFVWGDNSCGQLGLGDNQQRNIPDPEKMTSLSPDQVLDVACGCENTLAATKSGELLSWGSVIAIMSNVHCTFNKYHVIP